MKDQILSLLPEDHPWRNNIHWFNSIDSTSDRARTLALNGALHGTVLIAEQQTNGHGRMGRNFYSPAGNGIYMSLILRPDCTAESLMHLTCSVAVAICNAIEEATGLRPGIKWTNDLVYKGRKLGGILTGLYMQPGENYVHHAIIGIGINCNQSPEDFPSQLQNIAGSLSVACKKAVDRPVIAASMIRALYRMDQMLLQKKETLINAYKADCITLGQRIVVSCGDNRRYGKALDIDSDGGLIVYFEDGLTETVTSGEVSIRGMYGYV